MITVIKRLYELETPQLFIKGLKGVLTLLMGVILFSLLAGVIRTALELKSFWKEDLEVVCRQIIIDSLILLALIEVFRTLLAYLTEGRVKVTFIVDTVLVVLLTEVISVWFKGGDWKTYGFISLVILSLGVLRLIAIRYSPAIKTEIKEGN